MTKPIKTHQIISPCSCSKLKERKGLEPNHFCESGWWKNGYENWNDVEFKNHLRLKRETFKLVLSVVIAFT